MQTPVRPTQNGWCPPDSFALVAGGVYRSAYPAENSVPFLRSIGIKTVALLSIERLPRHVMEALAEAPASAGTAAGARARQPEQSPSGGADARTQGITVVQVANLRSWQQSLHNSNDDFSEQDVQRALDMAVDAQWHPVLFTTPSGELETSAVVGCMRRIQHWSLSAILSECELFAVHPKLPLRRSVTNFLAAWTSEQYPINEADVLYRNHQWFSQQHTQSSARHRRRRDVSAQEVSPTEPFEGASKRHVDDSASSDGSDSDTQANESPGQDIILSSIERARRSGTYPHHARARRTTGPTQTKRMPPASSQEELGGQCIAFADWYLQAVAYVPEIVYAEQASRTAHTADAAPHVLVQGVRNPPAIDPRSTFTKESIVEEDDD